MVESHESKCSTKVNLFLHVLLPFDIIHSVLWGVRVEKELDIKNIAFMSKTFQNWLPFHGLVSNKKMV